MTPFGGRPKQMTPWMRREWVQLGRLILKALDKTAQISKRESDFLRRRAGLMLDLEEKE